MSEQHSSDFMKICVNCMERRNSIPICNHCGYDESKYSDHPLLLKPRTILKDQYLLGRVLGQGGFGITYIGMDINLDKKVAIKEFLPTSLASRELSNYTVLPFKGSQEENFREGLRLFIDEARKVTKFANNVNIVHVINFFEANNTGYIVMDYIDGDTLSNLIKKRGGRLPVDESLRLMLPILAALKEVHALALYHRDISSQNIYVTSTGTPILIDFGAARYVSAEQSHSLDVVLKAGYAPMEQYQARGKIGPWTDIYACGATLYLMITGILPPPAPDRFYVDELKQPSDIEGIDISPVLSNAILQALAVRIEDRFKGIDEFIAAIERDPQGEYVELLEKHLAHKRITLDKRIALDQFMTANNIDKATAITLENDIRARLNVDKLQWENEYKDNYIQLSKNHPDGIPDQRIEQLDSTYVTTGRVAHRLVLKDASAKKKASKQSPEVEAKRYAEVSKGHVAGAPLEKTPPASSKKGIYAAVAAVAGVIIVALFLFVMPATKKPFAPPLPVPQPTVISPSADVRYGYINVWSRPSAEVFIDGTSVGKTPLPQLKVRAGKVNIKLVNKAYNINESYEEDVKPE
ncbi:MAG: serine/threonine protein kinase [Nitrospirae bacterium]|uniref:serine/threonine protein kinase n=1 Tax=Candidatus Magnetobacterium casense TaxID=1455061 RepID=UPI0006981B46|nr:serine/threonine-protein kinase [Candidatus Magnetobacterium casensis]MBF0336958.1 serine/threonine protein kinase [Nitrospirota bacterium]